MTVREYHTEAKFTIFTVEGAVTSFSFDDVFQMNSGQNCPQVIIHDALNPHVFQTVRIGDLVP